MQFIFQFCQPICGNSEHWYKHNTISYLHPHVEIRPEKKMYIGLSISLDLYICRVFFRMHNEKKQKKIYTNRQNLGKYIKYILTNIYDIWGKQHIIFFLLETKNKIMHTYKGNFQPLKKNWSTGVLVKKNYKVYCEFGTKHFCGQ